MRFVCDYLDHFFYDLFHILILHVSLINIEHSAFTDTIQRHITLLCSAEPSTVHTVVHSVFSVSHHDSWSISNPQPMLHWATFSPLHFFILCTLCLLSLSFTPLSGGLPAMSPWLLLRHRGALSAFRSMLGRFLLSAGGRSSWPSLQRQTGRTVPKRSDHIS